MWWVYSIQSIKKRICPRTGKSLPGIIYVGCTKDLYRRIRQHNGEIVGGARFTTDYRPWIPRSAYGPYNDRSTAQQAEEILKKRKGEERVYWCKEDSPLCKGDGIKHEWVKLGGRKIQ